MGKGGQKTTTSLAGTSATVSSGSSSSTAPVRGGGGVCPVKHHDKFKDLNVSEAHELGKASEGKTRVLTSIPEGYRMEATGVRLVMPVEQQQQQQLQFRGTITTTTTTNSAKQKKQQQPHPQDLPKRNLPDWSGLHVRIGDGGDLLQIHIQSRPVVSASASSDADAAAVASWTEITPSAILMDPLKAFTVQDNDIVWYSQTLGGDSSEEETGLKIKIWVQLSLMRKSTDILLKSFGTKIKAKIRKKQQVKVKIEPRSRDTVKVKEENDILQKLLDTPDPMTRQDIVFMKDIWNKCLGWIDLTGEFMVEGLFLRCPDLLEIFGSATAELMFDMLVSLIDKAVRALDPRTEIIARESYRQAPLGSARTADSPFQTLGEGFLQFAQLGMRHHHWKEARSLFLLAMKDANPYVEEADIEVLEEGEDSCAHRFWTHHIMKPAGVAIQQVDAVFDNPTNRQLLQQSFEPLKKDKQASGMVFYQNLFNSHPEVMPYFGTTNMNFLAGHLFDAIELLLQVYNDFDKAMSVLGHLGRIHDNLGIPVAAYGAIGGILDKTLRETKESIYGSDTPDGKKVVMIWSALMNRTVLVTTRLSFVSERLIRKAFEWSEQVAHELKWTDEYLIKRKIDIETEIRTRGTYNHTEEEVVHGARVAWRNSAKCVGRIAWNTMLVRDRRHITNLDHIFAECLEHQRLATADGSLKAVMTVFRPRQPGTRLGLRFWNLQLIRFACYKLPDGTFMGDKANLQYTNECIEFGWKPPEPRTEFDVLPMVIEDTNKGITKMFEVPKEYHKVTMIEHPQYPEFAKLGLRWCVVPTVTCFTMMLGGLQYTCCPFNGWFMECEITRDLIESGRMNKMEAIARAIGVDPLDEDDFWRERVAHETNKAVMHSFRRDGHSIVDHVTAQGQFLAHDLREKREGRECPAQWSWVVPSSGGATMPVWHHEMRDFYIEPQYQYQVELFALRKLCNIPEAEVLGSGDQGQGAQEKLLILFASVTGAAESYAYRARKMLRPLQVTVKNCKDVDPKGLAKSFEANGGPYSALLFIGSTFGEGDPPPSAKKFYESILAMPEGSLSGVPYSVMAIGSMVYPDFCQAGIDLDKYLRKCGAKQLLPLKKGDEVNDQEGSVLQWIAAVGSLFDLEQKKALVLSGDATEEDDGPPVSVEILEEGDAKVKAAIEEEESLAKASGFVETSGVGAKARFLPEGYRLCSVKKNSELVDFSAPESKAMYRSTRFLEFDLGGLAREKTAESLIYETGDHARVLPSNPQDCVLEMCRCLKLSPSQWVHVAVQEGSGPKLMAPTARLGDLMSLEIDLATQESDGNLALFVRLLETARASLEAPEEDITDDQRAMLEKEVARLEKIVEDLTEGGHKKTSKDLLTKESGNSEGDALENLASGKGATEAKKEEAGGLTATSVSREIEMGKKAAIERIMDTHMDIPSILNEFPATASRLTLADYVEVLPRLKPRYYSIGSAAELHPSNLQLTVGVLTKVHKPTNKTRKGLCSNYLASRSVVGGSGSSIGTSKSDNIQSTMAAATIRLGLSQSSFRLPSDMTNPIIMVGPGTGISPMLGFLQAREAALKSKRPVRSSSRNSLRSAESTKRLGPCMVFFGCRAEEDFLHGAQMRKWAETGVITSLQVAFSRLTGKKKEYVQHRIASIRDEVWSILSHPKCHYYVCGDSQMAEDVYSELYRTAKIAGGLGHRDAFDFIEKMKLEHRFQTDTWGVVTKRDEALAKLVDKRYNQGADWFANITEGNNNKVENTISEDHEVENTTEDKYENSVDC